jgi:hypothetical protein
MEEGNIDQDGYYVFNRNKDNDPWYDSVKDDIQKKEKHDYLNKKRGNTNETPADDTKNKTDDVDKDFAYYGEDDLYYKEEKLTQGELKELKDEVRIYRLKLIPYLIDNEETVRKAIKRLTPVKQQGKQVKKQKTENKEAKPTEENKSFNDVLDLVSKLTELSYFDVYDDTIEKIDNAYGKRWKYRVYKPEGEKEEYGDFTTEQIKEWNANKSFENSDDAKFEFNIGGEVWFDKTDSLFKKYIGH